MQQIGPIHVGFKQEAPATVETPPGEMFASKSRADSPFFELSQEKPYNSDTIYRKYDNYTLFDKMRQDDQINAVLTLKKILIIDSDFEIVVEESDKDEEIKDFLESNLDEYIDEPFDKKLFNILSSKDYGFSLTEKVFGHEETEWGAKIVLKALKTRAPHSFREIVQDDIGRVIKIVQHTDTDPIDLNPEKFIHYTNMQEFDIPWGRSELNLGVYRAWLSKTEIIKYWNMYLERNGIPPVVGTLGPGQNSYKDDLLKVIDNVQAKTGIVVPEGVTVELLTDSGTKGESGFERAIDKYNTMMARSILVPDLAGMSGSETGGGSFALGESQIGILYSVIQQDRRQLERAITKEIIEPLVRWNYGTGYSAKFKFLQVDDKKRAEQSKIYLEALKSGKVEATLNQLNHFFGAIDYPELEEDQWEEMQAKKEEMREAMAEGMNNPKEEDPKGGSPKEEKPKQDEKGKVNPDVAKKEDKKEFQKVAYYRELTVYESKVDFQKVESDYDKLKDEYLPKLNDVFQLVINGLMADIKGRKIIELQKLDVINKLKLRNMAKVEKTFRDLNKDSFIAGGQSVDVKKFAIGGEPALDNEDVIEWLRQNTIYTSTEEAQNILKISKGTLFDAIRNGSGVRETMAMLDDALAGYDLTRAGLLDKTARLETIARTVTAKAYNEARAQQFGEMSEIIVGYQYSAIMDGRTSAVCTALDGKVFKPAEADYYKPPNHYNCRSLLVPIFDFEPVEFNTMPPTTAEDGGFLKLTGKSVKKPASPKHSEKSVQAVKYFSKIGYRRIRRAQTIDDVFNTKIDSIRNTTKISENMKADTIKRLSATHVEERIAFFEDFPDVIPKSDLVEGYIKTSQPYKGTIHRGIGWRDQKVSIPDAFKPGNVVNMNGTSSWSESAKVANEFSFGGDRIIFEVKNKTGVSIKDISANPGEKEVLMSKDARFEVLSQKKSKEGVWNIILNEI